MTRRVLWFLAVSALSLSALGCGDDAEDVTDAGNDAGGQGGMGGSDSGTDAGGNGGNGGTGGNMAVTMCGGTMCAELPTEAGNMGITRCCTDDEACGLQTPLVAGECLPEGAPGGIDTSCPSYDVMGLITWQGCCTPAGQCGALSTGANGLGCISNSVLMAPEQACTYDPNNMCQAIIAVACDGQEDCGSGELCCGQYQGSYTKTECRAVADCGELDATDGGFWSQMCHPGDTCVNDTYQCSQNLDLLPFDYLARCRDTGEEPSSNAATNGAGEIHCGESTCTSGQKCCISQPGLAVCADDDADCTCVSGEDGDAGTDAG